MVYAIRLPDGSLVQNIPDEVTPEEAKKRIVAAGLFKPPVPETTIAGQAKELVKGLVPGAVGLVEQAAIGASALLPEAYEKPTREAIARVAGAAKAPFAAAPGYEESVGRKLSEAIGSTVPFLAAGPLGLAGRVGAVGLGVGAGAGEARTRAEKEGATAEQRGTATALGIIPGAMEVFAPFHILKRIPEAATAQGVQLVKRALVAGGEEAAQEAASGFAQNLIAKGIYKPEQELIEGLGEQAAYGGATGAIVQGLMDLALGRRARGAAAPPPGAPAETPIERAAREAQAAAPAAAPAPAEIPPLPDTYAELALYGEQLKQLPKSKERDAALKAAREKREAIIAEEVKQNRLTAEKAKEFMTAEEAAAAEIQRRDELETEAPAETPPPAEAAPEPEVVKKGAPPPTGLQPEDLTTLGLKKKQPLYKRMLGKDMGDPAQRDAALADIENYLVKGHGSEESRASLTAFKERFAPAAEPAPTETPSVPTAAPVEQPSGASLAVAGEPVAGAAPGGAGVTEPTGVVPTVADVTEPAGREGQQPAAVESAPAPAPTKATEAPAFTEKDIEEALAANLITPEQAERAREELRTEEAPPTTTTAALQKQIDDIKAQMDALRQKNGRPPAKKSPARAKFDALQEQLNTLQPAEEGDLAERLKNMEASGVIGSRGTRSTVDVDAVRENLTKARAAPKIYEAVLNYIGVDKDGDYLPTTYSSDEAAELAGLKRSSGANVRRAAEAMGVTADVISRFHAGQRGDIVGVAKNVSESGTGAPVENVKPGLLYTPPTKKKPAKAVGFLRPALTEDDKLDFSTLTNRQVAEMYARASNFDPKRENNIEVINQLNGEIDARTKKDKKGMQQALDSAYRVVRIEEEEAAAEETETSELPKETGAEDTTRRLSDEIPGLTGRPTPGVASPGITRAVNRGDTRRALQAIRETPEATPLDHEVAQRLLGLGQFLGFPKIETRPKDQIKGSGQYNPSSDTASIAAGEEDTHTVLHEVTHAFVHKLIVANEKGLRNDAGYRDLKQLYDYLKKTYPALEKEYGMSSVTEFASEAMSNPQFQKKLGTIRYKTRAAWSQFVQAIRKLLKIGAGDSSALVEAIAGVDSLLRAGREYQKTGPDIGAGTVSVITPEAEAAAQGVDVIGEQKAAKPMSGNPAIKARIRVANNMAGLMDAFTKWYGGDVRTAMGRLNPTVLFSRALDADRISVEAQLIGGLKKVDGLIVATELTDADGKPVLGADGKPLSYKNVVARIADAAKKSKKPYEEYLKVIDTVLYGHREFNIRKNNELIEQQAQALEAAGKKAEAKKLREEIATLAIKDPKKLDELETEFQKDDFIKGISNDLDTIRFNFIDMLVDTGRISKEVAQEWKDNEGYIPFKRVQDYTDAFDEVGSSRRGVGATRNIKRFEGSTRMSTSVVENFSSLLDWATGEAMRNEARTRALQDMVLMGAAKPGGKPDFDAPGGVQDTFEDGVRKSYYVPDPMLMIGFGMQPYQMSGVVKALNRYGTRVLRAGVTSMPPFAIKQVFDDIVRGYTFAGVKDNIGLTKNALLNFPKNWINELFKKELFKTTKGQTNIKELRKLGIVATFDLSREGNIKDVMVEAGAKKESLFHAILRVMEAGAKASDISVRQAIYSQVLKETGDVAKAESAAREIINFSYQGSSDRVRMVASVVPFFNAYAQGMDKLATAAAGKVVGQTTGVARSMFYTRMMYLTALGLAYAVMMQDDDDYQALPDHVRDTHWIIPKVKINGQPVGIPVAPDLAFFFKAIPERAVRYLKYQGTDEERAALDVVSELFVRGYDVFSPPNVTPQLIRPVFENIINYSFFLGRPLESQTQLRMRPFLRYGVGTSDTMKAVSEILEDAANATGVEAFAISPIKLENAVRGLLGTTGGLALSMADMMINPDRTDRPLHQQLSSQLTGASAVLKNPVGTKYMDEIYSLEKKAEQAYTTYNRLLETAPEKADKFLEDNIGMYSIRDAVQGVMESIRSLNDTAKLIDRDTSMSPEERRKAIDELRAQQNDIARQVYMLRKQAMNIQLGL